MSDRLTGPQAALLRRLPDRPSDGKVVKGATLRVAKTLRDRGFAICTGSDGVRDWYARTKAGEAVLHLPENRRHRIRPTKAQLAILVKLDRGEGIGDDEYHAHKRTEQYVTPFDRTLALMADRGWIDWSGAVSDVAITESGRTLIPRPRT